MPFEINMSPEMIVLSILAMALTLYVILGGADFGAGIWEFRQLLRTDERERNLLYQAIGPVWETNHVWLIFILVLLFGAFPKAFAALTQALFVPLSLGLLGIVFRGAAYAFRSPLKHEPEKQRPWVILFAWASALAPFFLGCAAGAVAMAQLSFDDQGNFQGSYAWDWISPFSIFIGLFTVGLCAYNAAAFMVREARMQQQADLVRLWRGRALAVGVSMGGFALAGIGLASQASEFLWEGIGQRAWPLVALSVLTGFLSLVTIYRARDGATVLLTSLTTATVVLGWLVAQYPYLLPPAWKVDEAASPPDVLYIMIGVTAVGALLLVPAIWLLFKIFKMELASSTDEVNRAE